MPKTMDSRRTFLKIDLGGQPQRIEAVWHGHAQGAPTLVFLHEGLGSVSQWADFPEALARSTERPALVYSRLGYGRSSPIVPPRPLTYMHREAQVVLPHILDLLSLQDVLLVGHSDGASIALIYAASAHGRARVRGLILEAPHVFCEPRSVAAIRRARAEFTQSSPEGQRSFRGALARHHDDVDGAFWGWNSAWLHPDFERWNLEGFLPQVVAPSLVIQSEHDPYGSVAQVDAIASQSGAAVDRLILSDCGHSPHRDQRSAVLSAMTDFVDLARQAPSKPPH